MRKKVVNNSEVRIGILQHACVMILRGKEVSKFRWKELRKKKRSKKFGGPEIERRWDLPVPSLSYVADG
jgi:hypothetical protein